MIWIILTCLGALFLLWVILGEIIRGNSRFGTVIPVGEIHQGKELRIPNAPVAPLLSLSFGALAFWLSPDLSLTLKGFIGITSGLSIYFVLSQVIAQRRKRLLIRAVPEMIDLLVRGMAAGRNADQAFREARERSPGILKSYMDDAIRMVNQGSTIHAAILAMGKSTSIRELRLVAITLRIQDENGGSSAESLQKLSAILRERINFEGKKKALSAQARWSSLFMSAFPVGIILILGLVRPDHFEASRESSLFIPFALLVGSMLIANLVYMRIVTREK